MNFVDPNGLKSDKDGDYSVFGISDIVTMIGGTIIGFIRYESKVSDGDTITPDEAKSLISITLGIHPQLLPDPVLGYIGGPTTVEVADLAVDNTLKAFNRTNCYLQSIGE